MRLSLRIKTVTAIVLMSLLISAAAIILSYLTYARTMDDHYKDLAVNLAYTAAAMVDADRVQRYIETLEPDEAYEGQLAILEAIRVANHVESIYILELRETEACTILDPDPEIPFGHIDPLVQPMAQEEDALVYISNTESYGWLCSSEVWLRDAEGYGYAVACVDISMNEVMETRSSFFALVSITVFVAVLIACVILTLWVGRSIIRPINKLAAATDSFISDREKQENGADGQTAEPASAGRNTELASAITRLDIRTGDELESLSDSIQKMEQEINEYIRNLTAVTAEKERIGAELGVATQIQASMLPGIFPAFPERKEFDIFASMLPAREVGGDFYDFFLIDEDHLALVIADVSGKGVPAALFMVIAKTLLKNCAQTGASPAEVLSAVNRQLCETNEAEMFVTVWLGILEISTGRLTCANAGHEFPALRRVGGRYELYRDPHDFVLGGMDFMTYGEYELQLAPGDMLYVYTDGVAEATNDRNELYETDRLLEALNRNPALRPQALLPEVKRHIDAFVGSAPQFDDITMLGFLYFGPGGDPEAKQA